MSNKGSYAERPIPFHGILNKQPIFLSDSKARYIQKHRHFIEDHGYFIDFQFRPGARFLDLYFWLERNLAQKVQQYGNIICYAWLGTCDLTARKTYVEKVGRRYKKHSYIELRHKDDASAIAYVKQQIEKFCRLVSNFPSVQIVFLEIPCYSIEAYNKHLGVDNPEDFHASGLLLTERIGIINVHIRDVNKESGFSTPRFKNDLIKYRKAEGKSQRKSLTFTDYLDGLHPDNALARIWMKKIVTHMFHYCK